MSQVTALILAIGECKRMKSEKAKATQRLCGRTMTILVICGDTPLISSKKITNAIEYPQSSKKELWHRSFGALIGPGACLCE